MAVNGSLFVKRIENGYLIELTDNYAVFQYVFEKWKDALAFIKDNQPKTYEQITETVGIV